jgi:hypothetical protein
MEKKSSECEREKKLPSFSRKVEEANEKEWLAFIQYYTSICARSTAIQLGFLT